MTALPTLTIALMLVMAFGAATGYFLVRRVLSFGAWVDALLFALLGAVLVGRGFHVLLYWGYFAEHLPEAFNLYAGGFNWHGAVLGGVAGVWGYVKSHTSGAVAARVLFADLLDALAVLLPLLALAGWIGCGAAACGYGREVDTLANYPAFAVSEQRDVYGIIAPRFNTTWFGIALATGVGMVALFVVWRGWLREHRFPLPLGLLSVGMFVIGFFRGDPSPTILSLRADQWLDVGFFMVSIMAFLTRRRKDGKSQRV